ncbi:MAG: ribonuclease H-like domain-containing protein [Bacillota bacterium]|nr:ribonuclease H-like domain-containing protein [Bacillota bacterium]MDI7248557.1 ribonuclease H-like domain-containing protein [Bacillota bacterium]
MTVGDTVPDVLFFDLETQFLFQEVGGRFPDRLRLACGVVWSTRWRRFEDYLEDQASLLVERLRGADLVVGFNLLAFDYPVLAPYAGGQLDGIPTLDILRELETRLGYRVSLASLAMATLGRGKTADGVQSVQWFREGRLDLVIEYCRADVQVTRELFEFGLRHGYLLFPDRTGQRRRVETPWGANQLLRQMWERATA